MKAVYEYEAANKIKETYKAYKGLEKAWNKIGNFNSADQAGLEADDIACQESQDNYYDNM